MVDWTRLDGTAIPSGQAFTPGALSVTGTGIGTITNVSPGNQQNTISFTDVTGATSYNIYWDTSSGVTTADNKITGVTSPHVHSGLSNGTTYYYVYTAVVDEVETSVSNEMSGTPNTSPPSTTKVLMFAVK